MIKIQGIPTASAPVAEVQKVEDPTVVRRILKGTVVEKVIVENGQHRVVFNLLTDTIEEINFPGHPNGTLADLVNLVNRLVREAERSVNLVNVKLAEIIF